MSSNDYHLFYTSKKRHIPKERKINLSNTIKLNLAVLYQQINAIPNGFS